MNEGVYLDSLWEADTNWWEKYYFKEDEEEFEND
jgi:hypothetical protein